MHRYNWQHQQDLSSRGYACGYCGNALASAKGWIGSNVTNANEKAYIYICHHCTGPTFFDQQGRQSPGVVFGSPVKDIPEQTVADLYDEARRSTGAGAYTAAVLACRKLLMHIAVSKGAKPGESFASYIAYLADNHYVSPDAREWVDHIRKKGNEANHEISIMSSADAEELLAFIEMLLKTIFEFPAAIRKKLSVAQPHP